MTIYKVGTLALNSTHFTRGLVKYVSGRDYFRAVPSQNGDKFATSPTPQSLNDSAVTRSGSRRTGLSGAFALLEADEHMICSLATEPEADGDLELPATLPCDKDARKIRAHLGGGEAQGVCRTYSGWDV